SSSYHKHYGSVVQISDRAHVSPKPHSSSYEIHFVPAELIDNEYWLARFSTFTFAGEKILVDRRAVASFIRCDYSRKMMRTFLGKAMSCDIPVCRSRRISSLKKRNIALMNGIQGWVEDVVLIACLRLSCISPLMAWAANLTRKALMIANRVTPKLLPKSPQNSSVQ
uniref:Uncharacterized protein n=1 Tax=Parascaris univalens TaxID=6257 RepID=A0A915AWH5_PARUN